MEDLTMYLSIGEKAKECGVSVATLRRWDKRGLLKPDISTAGGHRRYKNKNRTERIPSRFLIVIDNAFNSVRFYQWALNNVLMPI